MRGVEHYARLDYSQWNRVQRVAKAGIALLVHAALRVRVDGLERIPPSGPAIIAGNHLSLLDSVVVIPYLRRPAILLLAAEVHAWPGVRFVFGRLGNAIVVRRGSGDARPLDYGVAVLSAGGLVAIAPEGRRSKTGALEPARTGVARLAIASGAPVIPVAIWGQERVAASWRRLRRAPVQIRFGLPLAFDGASDAAEVTTRVMVAIARMLPPEYRGAYAEEARDVVEPA